MAKNLILKPGMLKTYDTGKSKPQIQTSIGVMHDNIKQIQNLKKPKKVVGWNLWDDGVSQSFIGSYCFCRAQTRLKYLELWQSDGTSLPLEFGNCSHWLFSKIYQLSEAPTVKMILDLLKKYKKNWKKDNPLPSIKALKNQERIYGMIAEVLPEYIKRWDGDWTGKYRYGNDTVRPEKWLDLEERHTREYVYPDGKKTFMLAVFDGAFYDKKKGIWIFESKTKGRIDEETLQDCILFDTQVMLSLWIARDVVKKKPSGVLYNVLRRPGQKDFKGETLKEFCGRVKKDVSNVKRYDHYFKRWEFAIDYSEVLEWKKDFLDPVMLEIRMWFEGKLPTYVDPFSLVSKYGRCDMYAPLVWGDYTKCSQRAQYRKDKKK